MSRPLPPDQPQREQALDPDCSILVQAPAGSGKTDLLTRRFLRLLGEVDDPTQIVAITFTKAAAAEMRHRILSELEKAAALPGAPVESDAFSMPALARRALARSRTLGWQLPDLPAQLRISTIDSFCRELAIQQPLLSGFASELTLARQPDELYRRAAHATLARIGSAAPAFDAAIEALLVWRDNNWRDLEDQLVQMLRQRDRWMQDFVLDREPDWDALRMRLERPFARAVADTLEHASSLLNQLPHAPAEAMTLARFACGQLEGRRLQDLAELVEFPAPPFYTSDQLEAARAAFVCLADLLLTVDGAFRSGIDKRLGFPADRKAEKARLAALIASARTIPGFESALAAVRSLPPARYTEDDWRIVSACFTLLRHAAAELRVVFASAGVVDFIEVAQIAQRVLVADDGQPSDAALAVADGIHHLLVDEFQDTSRRQHRLLASIVAAWPEPTGRTLFVVGDPMQSIYSFREADAELFPRVQQFGLELPGEALPLRFVPLATNFRTEPTLVEALNQAFAAIFAQNDGSGVPFSPALPARTAAEIPGPPFMLHLKFLPQSASAEEREAAHAEQTRKLVELIQSHLPHIAAARTRGDKYRIAVLGRARKSLVPIARALRQAAIPFLAVELEQLTNRPEVLDALSLGRALLNPLDRVAWLGVLRAPWCGLALADLHALTSADDPAVLQRPIPELLAERIDLVSDESRRAVERVLRAASAAAPIANAMPTASLGTWLEQVWLELGGTSCADATARTNLDLLWNCIDQLPNGAQDLLSPALDTALKDLTALPDAESDSECGVQLMTMHKSKGLEFEVVLVPDLQAASGRTRHGLLSWLERGLVEPEDSGAVTEFLVAPLPSKGAERGGAKAWVDRVHRDRETREMRRILYVAATRAREELHLFARPTYKLAGESLTLAEPANSLLATAWPALAQQVQERFDVWQASTPADPEVDEQIVESLAAAAINVLVMPSPAQPVVLQRLPSDFDLNAPEHAYNARQPIAAIDATRLYARHEGGALSRALGTAVHSLLEETARLRTTLGWPATREALLQRQPRIIAQLRAAGLRPSQAESVAARAIESALAAARDPHGQWLLSPHAEAASEAAFAGVLGGAVRTVRVDRLFRAGLEPLVEGSDAWWIVDYKTAYANDLDPAVALPELRRLFAPQLETYAAILRRFHGADALLRAALYYPRMSLFDWWEIAF